MKNTWSWRWRARISRCPFSKATKDAFVSCLFPCSPSPCLIIYILLNYVFSWPRRRIFVLWIDSNNVFSTFSYFGTVIKCTTKNASAWRIEPTYDNFIHLLSLKNPQIEFSLSSFSRKVDRKKFFVTFFLEKLPKTIFILVVCLKISRKFFFVVSLLKNCPEENCLSFSLENLPRKHFFGSYRSKLHLENNYFLILARKIAYEHFFSSFSWCALTNTDLL